MKVDDVLSQIKVDRTIHSLVNVPHDIGYSMKEGLYGRVQNLEVNSGLFVTWIHILLMSVYLKVSVSDNKGTLKNISILGEVIKVKTY